MTTIAPPRVRRGDAVAIISPSAPAIDWWPHRAERGMRYLESLGLRPRLMPNAGGRERWTSGSGRRRADDIHRAFADPEVSVVLCAIGGNHSNQVVPHLDYRVIADNPKIFQGYSDVTVLHWALLARAGLRTFYGPALTVELAEYPQVLPYTDAALRTAWFGEAPPVVRPAREWTDERLDFFAKDDLRRARELRPSDGWVTVRGGRAQGPLLGGCLETICWHLTGSDIAVDLSGAVLLLETSEQSRSPADVDSYLTDLRDTLASVAGVVFARPYRFSRDDAAALWDVVREHTAPSGVPVIGNVELGHADPMLTLPLGTPVRMDADALTFDVLEPATQGRDVT